MNEKVINAISSLEQEVLKTLKDGELLEAQDIAALLGTEVISKRPDGKSTGIANPVHYRYSLGVRKKKTGKTEFPIRPLGNNELRQRIHPWIDF